MATTRGPAWGANLKGRLSRLRRDTPRVLRARGFRVLVVRLLGVAALFALEITLARRLGTTGYGAFSFTLAAATLISRLAPLGWLNATTRLVSAYGGGGQLDRLKGSLIVAHAATALGLAATAPALLALGRQGVLPATAPALPILLLGFVLALLELYRHTLRGLHQGDLGEALIILLLPGFATALLWAVRVRSPAEAVALYSVVAGLLALLAVLLVRRYLPAGVRAVRAAFEVGGWSLLALPMLVAAASDELLARTAVFVLGGLADTEAVGLYQAAVRLALMNLFVLRALTPVVAPRLSVLHHHDQREALRRAYLRACLLSFLGALPAFAAFMLVPGPILAWFGPDFVAAAPLLRWLSLGYLVAAACGPCATALMMIGRQRLYGLLSVITLLANLVLTYVLVRHAGAAGAAIATAFTLGVANLVYAALVLRAVR